MAMVPWTRRDNSGLARLHGELDDLFDGFFRGLDRPVFGYKAWPPIDVAEQDDAVLIRAEVPGCKPEDIDISVCGETLSISGQKQQSTEQKGDGFYHVETVHGNFRRDITLPVEVDGEKIEAVCRDGILSVTLPKAARSKAMKVKVKG
jgi:HSP20 family protein